MTMTSRTKTYIAFSFLLLFAIGLASQRAAAQNHDPRSLQVGIDPRSNLTGQSEDARQKTLEGIKALGGTWVRDGFAISPHGPSDLVDVVRRAEQLRLRFIVQILQVDADYDGPLENNRCGWHAKALSKIDLTKYANRIRAQLEALKAANLTVDAFEIGNEDDTDCYNADIPTGHVATPQEIEVALRGYGKFLATSAMLIHDPRYFPRAKLITFGMAHGGTPTNSLPDPARFVARLHNVDGVDYLENDKYRVDGYGTHIYASPSNVSKSVEQLLQSDAAALGTQKPFWLTEWGFLNYNAFPTKNGKTIGEAIADYFSTIDDLHKRIPLGPMSFYSYNVWLVDSNGNPLPQAAEFEKLAKANSR